MGASVARVEANRLNARKSTGPRTAEGKARSRANAVKHGLTGAGVALPNEDAARVEERFLGLQAAMGPSDDLGMVLVHKVALMSVRAERAARHETVALSLKMRHAAEEFDLARLEQIERWFNAIETDAPVIRRRLLTSVEGVDKLVGALKCARHQLVSGVYKTWDHKKREKVEAFFGGNSKDFPVSRTDAVLSVLEDYNYWLEPEEIAHLATRDQRQEWARVELIKLIDAELDTLAAARARINPEILELDRLEAADRAMFDTSPDATLARKYEAAANRGFFRSLWDFRQNEARLEVSSDEASTFLQDDNITPPKAVIPEPDVLHEEESFVDAEDGESFDEQGDDEAEEVNQTPVANVDLPAPKICSNEPNVNPQRDLNRGQYQPQINPTEGSSIFNYRY